MQEGASCNGRQPAATSDIHLRRTTEVLMDAFHSSSSVRGERNTVSGVVFELLAALWYPVRLALFAVLALFEPLIRIVLAGFALGGFFAWFVFKELAHARSFPTETVLALSVGCAVLLVVYYMLMRWLRP